MPVKRPQLINGEIYHIVMRGVADSLIFKDENDYYRGIFSLYEFNDVKNVIMRNRRRNRIRAKKSGQEQFSASRELLAEILAFKFMPNHIHLLLKQIKNNGITKFMRKFGAGYVAYFNKMYDRKGHLFQGRFRAVHIKNDKQLRTVFVYIHINGISLLEPGWKDNGIKNPEKIIKFLENDKWSSYPDYIGKKNFPSVTERKFLFEIMDGESGCKKFVENWIKYKSKTDIFGKIALE